MPRRPCLLTAALTAFSVAQAGCRFEPAAAPAPWPASAGAPALPYRVGVAPVRFPDDGMLARHAGVTTRHGSLPDAEQVRRELVAALRADGAFARVEPRGARTATPGHAEREAWDAHDDLLLEVAVLDHFQEYLGHCNYVAWFVVYTWLVWPAWWIPVDLYGAGLRVSVTLRGVQGQAEPLLERTYEVRPAEVAQELTPSDRELVGVLDWAALWNVDASLEASNWAAIERIVAPHALRAVSRRLVQDVRAAVVAPLAPDAPEAEREPLLRRARKRMAVVAGVSTYGDPAVGGGAHAAEDARALAHVLASPPGGRLVPDRDLLLLTDEQATRDGLLSAIAAVGSRTTPDDELIVYVAALGTTLEPRAPAPDSSGGEPAFLLFDARADDLPGTALGLRGLGEALARVPAGRVLLVLDGAFGGHVPGSRSHAAPPVALPTEQGVVAALGLGPGRVALLASRPGRPARTLPGAGAGLFCEVLRGGLTGAADTDQDGRVTLPELAAHARDAVAARAALEGFEQEPALLGPVDDVSLGWPR